MDSSIYYYYYVGLLDAVGSLMLTTTKSVSTLTWTPPFSLDITGIHPDIAGYCVDVTTANSSIHSECGITRTEFSYDSITNLCTVVKFTVTPINVVGNGTRRTVETTVPRK